VFLHDEHVVNDKNEVSIPSNEMIVDVHKSEEPPKGSNVTSPKPYTLLLPFPQRMAKAKLDLQFGKFLEVLKKLYVNIPFTEVLSEMPSYAKFLKEILSNKRKLEDHEMLSLTEESSVAFQNKLPVKFKDPRSFPILCLIGNVSINRVLCDLGPCVNLMPLSLCKKLELGEMKPTIISLQLADHSVKYPIGVLDNVPIKVGDLYVLLDL